MKCRDFVYAGETVPPIAEQEHAAFLLQLEKSILASLKKRELLNDAQYQRCTCEIEKQYSRSMTDAGDVFYEQI